MLRDHGRGVPTTGGPPMTTPPDDIVERLRALAETHDYARAIEVGYEAADEIARLRALPLAAYPDYPARGAEDTPLYEAISIYEAERYDGPESTFDAQTSAIDAANLAPFRKALAHIAPFPPSVILARIEALR